MQFSLFDVLLLIGITQGIVAVPLLLFAKKKRPGNVFLALAILSFCMLFIKIIMNYSGLLGTLTFRYFPNAFELATGPLLYFYALAITADGFKWNNKLLIHFIPFSLAISYALLVYYNVYGQSSILLKDQTASKLYYQPIKELEDWLIIISILGYLFLGYQQFRKFQKQVQDTTADSAYPTLRWVKSILFLCIILFLALLINMLLSRLTNINNVTDLHWQLLYTYQAGITYYLGFMAYRQPEIDLKQIYLTEESDNKKYGENNELELVVSQLEAALSSQSLYRDPMLNIAQVSKVLNIRSSNLSQIINTHYKKSFRALINEYRIEDIKRKLLDTENKASILSLALESGFNSEASFYRVFKASTGMTPKDFIQKNKNN